MTDEIVFLEPGGEQAQKIARAMASPTAGDLLRGLADAPKSTTALSDELHIPLTTAKYHLGNLLDAGVIEVVDTRWSAKGREVKLYALKNQVLIVAPQRKSAIGLMKKYAATLGIFVAGTALLSLYLPAVTQKDAEMVLYTAPDDMLAAVRMTGETAPLPPMMHEFVTAFFLGGCLVLIALMLYEAVNWRRERN